MARKTKNAVENTRERIIDAAEKVFFVQGVSRTTLEQIAAAAGVSRDVVARHFKRNDVLCAAMAERLILPHQNIMESLVSNPSGDPLLDLKKACVHSLEAMSKDKKMRDVLTILVLRCEYVEEMLGVIAKTNTDKSNLLVLVENLFFRAQILKKLAPCWTPRQAAVATMALMMGLFLSGLKDQKSFDFSTVGAACVEAFFCSLHA
jgi:AcrR family transcriptional regulator